MRADRDAVLDGVRNTPPHRHRIAAMEAAGEARGGDARQQLLVGSELPVAERLAEIAVDVHAHAGASDDAISDCSSRAICCASSTLTAAKRTDSIGRI